VSYFENLLIMKKIGIAADHGGYSMKEFLTTELRKNGYMVTDFGNDLYDKNDDFPDYVLPLARAVASGAVSRGIAVCGSGVGACIAANKIGGVRASLVTESFSAHQGVEDDDMNLMCLGGRVTGQNLAWELVTTFLNAKFKNEERHNRRLNKIVQAEKQTVGT
jgi:ribose 5-phosphate isomerase B